MKQFFGRLYGIVLSPKVVLGVTLLVVIFLCAYPLAFLIYKCLFSGGGGSEFTLESFYKIFASDSTFKSILNTVFISAGTAVFSTLLALPLSWLFTRTDLPGKTKWRSLFCLPYMIPPYIGAIAWIYLANPSTGILNRLFFEGAFNIYTVGGLIWVMSSFFYTFILLSVMTALDRMDSSLEEAARLSGASPFHVFKDITLPLIFPSLLSGVLLVVLAAAASFGVPAMIGTPGRIFLMTTKIYTLQKMGSLSGLLQSGSLATILLLIALFILIFNQWLLRKNRFQIVTGKTARPSLIELGGSKGPILTFLVFLFSGLFLLPLFGILWASLSKVQGILRFDNLGFQTYYTIFFENEATFRAFANSFQLAVGAATLAAIVGLVVAYIQTKTRLPGRSMIDIVASIPYATPGTVVALALIMVFSTTFFGFSLYNTLALIGIAYFVKYLSFSVRTCVDGFHQIDNSLAEAARVSGANWFQTLKTIWFPLMKPSLVAAWFLIFMPAFSELTMTILLSGPGIETIGTLLFQLQEYGDASGGGAAVLSLVIIIFVTIINWLVKILSKGKYGL